jgi:hypothetical protein
MKKYHNVEKLAFARGVMLLVVDGKEYKFKLAEISKRLASASTQERENYQISASGYGIHWPGIDEDLSIDGLIGVKHSSEQSGKCVPA